MDFWVVVAAAGAGYVAQYLQNSSVEKENFLVDNKNLLQQIREKVCPFHKLARKRAKKEVPDEGAFGFRHLNLDTSHDTSDEKDSTFPSSTSYERAIQSKPEEYTSSSGPFNSTGSNFNNDMKFILIQLIYTDIVEKFYSISAFDMLLNGVTCSYHLGDGVLVYIS